MIRVVLDTNVFVSALINPQGAPGIIVAKWLAGEFENCLTKAMLAELDRTLGYPKVRKYVKLNESERGALLASFDILSVPVEPLALIERNVRDVNDVPILAAAVTSQSQYLVTGDEDLLVLKEHAGTLIVTPREFLQLLDAL